MYTTRLCQQVTAAVPDLIKVKGPSNRTTLAFDENVSKASPTPPSLSRKGQMYHGTKSDILPLLEAEAPPGPSSKPPTDAAVLDGPAIIHLIKPGTAATIGEYIQVQVVPYLLGWMGSLSRLDIVWDVYKKDSLKLGTRENRGTGIRRRVTTQTKIPSNYSGFLRVDTNKAELFTVISD